jgi:hypothetical protein
MLAGLISRWMMPLGVGSIECIRDIDSKAEQFVGRQRPAHDALAQARPFE